MAKAVYVEDEYIVKEDEKGYVLINTNGEYKNHGHLKNLKTTKLVIRLMKKKTIPRSPYLRGTVLRVSLDKDYKQKVLDKIRRERSKGYYININKGLIRN